jgi:hypothetical protein
MDRLHRCDHAQLGQPPNVVRVEELDVLDPVAQLTPP